MQQFIANYGYLAVFVLMVAESACIPVPSELTMTLAGALAADAVAGAHLNLVLVIVVGVVGNLVGSYLAWLVGRYAGPAAWRRWGRYLLLRGADIDRAERWFARHGGAAVCVGRLLPVVRTFISLPAGFARMPAGRFGVYTVAGCIPWVAALAGAGYAVGAHWQGIADGFHGPTYVIAAIAVVAVAAAWLLTARRRHRGSATEAGPAGSAAAARAEEG